MAAKKRRTRNAIQRTRSPKAPRAPRDSAASPQVQRRRKSATAAVRKDTMVTQTEEARVWWGVGKPKEKKR